MGIILGLMLVLLMRFSGALELVHRPRIPAAPASEGETLSVFPSLVLLCLAWQVQGVVVIQSLMILAALR